jgi:plastocyanin
MGVLCHQQAGMDERMLSCFKAAGRWVSAMAVCVLLAPAGAAAADHPVTATSGNAFSPAQVMIPVGDSVRWTNAGGPHNVAFDDGNFTVPMTAQLPAGWPALVRRTFNVPGQFGYVCVQHEASFGMVGTVTVSATPPPPPGTPPPPGRDPGSPGTGTPGGQPAPKKQAIKITLRVSDPTPRSGSRVRFYGSVTPADDGRKIRLQKRARGGTFKTVVGVTLRDAGSTRSTFSRRLKVKADGVYRARFGSALSGRRKLDVSAVSRA